MRLRWVEAGTLLGEPDPETDDSTVYIPVHKIWAEEPDYFKLQVWAGGVWKDVKIEWKREGE
jgi:hypothetical protein